MRFQFRGFHRETGKPVNGHVEAPHAEAAYQVLSDRRIVTESLQGDPEPAHVPAHIPSSTPDIRLFENELEEALEDALNSSSTKVPFDALTKIYRGRKVRVIDRDKIRARVAQVVDSTLAASEADRESTGTARERVADAISGLFHDPRNIATEHKPQDVAKMDANGLAAQIGKLSGVVQQAEGLIAAMQSALRNVESGGSGPRRHVVSASSFAGGEQDSVLRDILQSNLELRRAIAGSSVPKANQPEI